MDFHREVIPRDHRPGLLSGAYDKRGKHASAGVLSQGGVGCGGCPACSSGDSGVGTWRKVSEDYFQGMDLYGDRIDLSTPGGCRACGWPGAKATEWRPLPPLNPPGENCTSAQRTSGTRLRWPCAGRTTPATLADLPEQALESAHEERVDSVPQQLFFGHW